MNFIKRCYIYFKLRLRELGPIEVFQWQVAGNSTENGLNNKGNIFSHLTEVLRGELVNSATQLDLRFGSAILRALKTFPFTTTKGLQHIQPLHTDTMSQSILSHVLF